MDGGSGIEFASCPGKESQEKQDFGFLAHVMNRANGEGQLQLRHCIPKNRHMR